MLTIHNQALVFAAAILACGLLAGPALQALAVDRRQRGALGLSSLALGMLVVLGLAATRPLPAAQQPASSQPAEDVAPGDVNVAPGDAPAEAPLVEKLPADELPAEEADPPAETRAEAPAEAPPAETDAASQSDAAPTADQAEGSAGALRESESAPGQPGSLSIDLERSGLQIPPRPDWVLADPWTDQATGIHYIPVSSGPEHRVRDARKALDTQLEKAVAEYISQYLGSPHAATLIHYNADELKAQVVQPESLFEDQITIDFGVMHEAHGLVAIDDSFRGRLDGRWEELTRTSRLLLTGVGTAVVLSLLGLACGYFRVDTATKGYYTGRLQVALAMAILTVIGGGAYLARSSWQWVTYLF